MVRGDVGGVGAKVAVGGAGEEEDEDEDEEDEVGGSMWRSSSIGLPFLVRVTGSMSDGGGSSIVGRGGMVVVVFVVEEGGGGCSVVLAVVVSWVFFSSGFTPFPTAPCGLAASSCCACCDFEGGSSDVSCAGRGSIPLPALFAKAACKPAEGVVKGARWR